MEPPPYTPAKEPMAPHYPQAPAQPPYGPPPMHHQQQPQVVVMQQQPMPIIAGHYPVGNIQCRHCGQMITTQVTHVPGLLTWLICLFTFPCCCLPFLIDSCQNAEHRCPHCQNLLAEHKAF